MLDVHPPHTATHGWRDFFIHIATIVVGLMIAVGLEQTVEYFHHRHQVHHLEDALREEGVENRAVIQHDIQSIDLALTAANADIAALQASGNTANLTHLDLFAPGDNAWLTMRDSGLLSIAPRLLVENYWKVYYTQQAVVARIEYAYSEQGHLAALLSLHVNGSALNPTDRDTILIAYANYRQSLVGLRITLEYLDQATALALQDRKLGIENALPKK
jgi:hypothetical protein